MTDKSDDAMITDDEINTEDASSSSFDQSENNFAKTSMTNGNAEQSSSMEINSTPIENDDSEIVFNDSNPDFVLDKPRHPSCQFQTDKNWLDCEYHDTKREKIKKPNEIEDEIEDPPESCNEKVLDRIQGSMFGLALGDALGAHVEFRPRDYLVEHPVDDLQGGGTWGLEKGQFTDDTSMALCLANSLVAQKGFNGYDQLVRYKWWYKHGYMSSTGQCFDIGSATSQSLNEFQRRQTKFCQEHQIPIEDMDFLSNIELLKQFDIYCSEENVAGNGALMRLSPVPLFFYKYPIAAVEFSGISGQITHGDQKAYDACRYYGALIVAALNGETKEQLLDKHFYQKHISWFNEKQLHPDIVEIAQGSYKKEQGYEQGIRGKGYIVNALEAALWAFWSDEDSFKKGAIAAVSLGDDTDTTAAIYGQLAGALYGYNNLPTEWIQHVYAKKFIENLSKWMAYEGERWNTNQIYSPFIILDLETYEDFIKKPINDDINPISDQSSDSTFDDSPANISSSHPPNQDNQSPDLSPISPNNISEDNTSSLVESNQDSNITPTYSQTTTSYSHTNYQDNQSSNYSSTSPKNISKDNLSNPFISNQDSTHIPIQSEKSNSYSNTIEQSNRSSNFPSTYHSQNKTLYHSTSDQTNPVSTSPFTIETIHNNTTYSSQSTSNSSSSTNKLSNVNKMLSMWTNNDVCQWVRSLDKNYEIYINGIKGAKLDGYSLYQYAGHDTLIKCGINNVEHRTKILDSIQQLRNSQKRSSYYPKN